MTDQGKKLWAIGAAAPVGGALDAELLPCPFCGSTNVDTEEWTNGNDEKGPGCNDCGALADSIELWNTRAQQSGAGQSVAVPTIPAFVVRHVEQAIHSAKNPVGMHTNGKCMVPIEVTHLERLLICAKAAAPLPPQNAAQEDDDECPTCLDFGDCPTCAGK